MLHIPDELIVVILAQLNYRDILTNTRVCQRWKRIVSESLVLRYCIELGVAGRVALDRGPSSAPEEPSYKTKLEELSNLCELWKKGTLTLKTGQSYTPTSASHKNALSGCIICRARSEDTRGVIDFVQPKQSLKLENWSWLTPHLGDYREVDISSSAGLLVGARSNNNIEEGSEVIIDFLSIEKGNYHVEAERQSIRLASCDRDGTTFINQICLYGNLFGIRFSSTFGSSFISRIKIYNWKTGDPISDTLHSSPYYRKNQGIVFLSKDAILTNSMHYYDGFIDATIEMFSLEETGLHLATFHLPKLSKEGHTIVKLLCSSSESDTVQCDRLTTTNLADARLLGITVRGSERVLEDNENICTFVTPLSLFTNYKSLFCHPGALVNEKRVDMNEDDAVVNIPWDAWGPKFTRLIPGSCTCSATYGWKISMEDGIYDFNQVDIARDLQRFGAAHWQHRDRSLITTESTTFNHSKFIDEITTSLPYRFINLEIPEGSDVILGENMIFRALPPFESISLLVDDGNDTLHATTYT